MALTEPPSSRMGGGRGHPNAAFLSTGLALLLVVAGCRSNSGPPLVQPAPASTTVAAPTSSAPTTTVPTTVDPAAEIVARYQQFWRARFEANQAPPRPDLAALADFATGQQLDQVRAETRTNLLQRLAVRHAATPINRGSTRVINLGAEETVLQECVVDDDVTYRYDTGEVVNSSVATHNVEARMRRVDGVWKLASARLLQRWEGVAGCALASGA